MDNRRDADARTRLHLIAKGRVQGVGYRFFCCRQAAALELVGWVRNCSDGSVEAEVEGAPAALRQFVLALRDGPSMARVAEVCEQKIAAQCDGTSFTIRH